MKYDFYLENCGDDDVISFSGQMIKISKFKQAVDWSNRKIIDAFVESLESHEVKGVHIYEGVSWGRGGTRMQNANYKWSSEGKDCEVLKDGSKGWEKGKIRVRVTLEFEPDELETNEPESSLEDLRQRLNKKSK